MRYLSMENVVNGVNWNKVDVLITTPGQMNIIYNYKDKRDPYEINPKYIVIDEADLLLGYKSIIIKKNLIYDNFSLLPRDTNLARTTKSILGRYINKKTIKEDGRQIILCGASLPNKIDGGDTDAVLKTLLKDFKRFKTGSFHKLSSKITHEILDLEKELKQNPDST